MNTLKQLRKEARLTQVEAAKICEVSRRTFQTYEENGLEGNTYDKLVNFLKKAKDYPPILPLQFIKMKAAEIFAKYPQVQCAYLFGSYARGEATIASDVDFLIVAPELGGFEFSGLHYDLRTALGKEVDLVSHETLLESEKMLRDILNQGVKLYGARINHKPN